MPDQRLARTRATLPADYQYGDARSSPRLAFHPLAFTMLFPMDTECGLVMLFGRGVVISEKTKEHAAANGWKAAE